jgi:putative MATE family efflux protein
MHKLVGDRHFYKKVLAISIPIMIQSGITNFVSLLDNIMVGQVGTEPMSGVAIVNQLIFVFNICIFGGISGAGIFGAQFFGYGDHQGVRNTFRLKLIICGFISVVAIAIFVLMGDPLINLYLSGDDPVAKLRTAEYARQYLLIMLIGMIPFAIEQSYSGTLRETGETVLPMKAGICAVLVNLILNYLLIFGKLGFPALGVVGAAIATVIARFVEMAIIIIWTHRNAVKNRFIVGAYRHFSIPGDLIRNVFIKGSPLMLNEVFWASAQAILMQCYSQRGLAVIAGFNISNTITNVFNIAFIALGGAVAIIIGQQLGANKLTEARETAWKLIAFSVASCIFMGILLALCAPFFPQSYNTTGEIRGLATQFMLVSAVYLPIHAFLHSAYFTLRAGGKTMITFIFDSGFAWCVSIPLAYCLCRFTGLPILTIYIICQSAELLKCFLGTYLLKKGYWIQNIVNKG